MRSAKKKKKKSWTDAAFVYLLAFKFPILAI